MLPVNWQKKNDVVHNGDNVVDNGRDNHSVFHFAQQGCANLFSVWKSCRNVLQRPKILEIVKKMHCKCSKIRKNLFNFEPTTLLNVKKSKVFFLKFELFAPLMFQFLAHCRMTGRLRSAVRSRIETFGWPL